MLVDKVLNEKVLRNILKSLTREDLEALQLVSTGLDDFVRNDVTDGPMRFLKCVVITSRNNCRIQNRRFTVYVNGISELKPLLKNAVVDWLV